MDEDKYIDWQAYHESELMVEFINKNEDVKDRFELWSMLQYNDEEQGRAELYSDVLSGN